MTLKTILLSLTLTGALVPALAIGFSFPEIGFCPLGGPPGWFNRLTGQHDQRYYGPPPRQFRPLYPPVAPNAWQSPVMRQPPVYFPVNPAQN